MHKAQVDIRGDGFDYLPKAIKFINEASDLDHALLLLRLAEKANVHTGFCGTGQGDVYGKIHYQRARVHVLRNDFLQGLVEIDSARRYNRHEELYSIFKIQMLTEIYGEETLQQQISDRIAHLTLPNNAIFGFACISLDSPTYEICLSTDNSLEQIDWRNTTLQDILIDMAP